MGMKIARLNRKMLIRQGRVKEKESAFICHAKWVEEVKKKVPPEEEFPSKHKNRKINCI